MGKSHRSTSTAAGSSSDHDHGHGDTSNSANQDRLREHRCAHGHRHKVNDQKGNVSLPSTKADALKLHQRSTAKVDTVLRSAMAQAPDKTGRQSRQTLLRNSAQWLSQGESKLYVMTPTDDTYSGKRVSGTSNAAFFDTSKIYSASGADYDPSNLSDARVEITSLSDVGGMSADGQKLQLYDAGDLTESKIAETLVHEVQHSADIGGLDSKGDGAFEAKDKCLKATTAHVNNFQSEFRAYWMETEEGSAKDRFGSSTKHASNVSAVVAMDANHDVKQVDTNFKNQRQEKVFNFLTKHTGRSLGRYKQGGKWTSAYSYVPYFYVLDAKYKKMVDDYDKPQGGNLVNSVRIQAISELLANNGSSAEIQTAIDALDTADTRILADRSASKPFWEQVNKSLAKNPTLLKILSVKISIGLLDARIAILKDKGSTRNVKTVRGDTLKGIAGRYLGSEARSEEIKKLNPVKLKTVTDKVPANLEIKVPKT